jgi:hypothetical protein
MRLHEELYFSFTIEGTAQNVKRFVSFLLSGDLDDFFEITDDNIIYSDNYSFASNAEPVSVTVSNDDYGIEIDSFNPEEFLDVLCAAGKELHIHGNLFDIDYEEYMFTSPIGSNSYTNAYDVDFHDELDDEARREESEEDNEDF